MMISATKAYSPLIPRSLDNFGGPTLITISTSIWKHVMSVKFGQCNTYTYLLQSQFPFLSFEKCTLTWCLCQSPMGITTSFMHTAHFPCIQNSVCYAMKMVIQLVHLFSKTFYANGKLLRQLLPIMVQHLFRLWSICQSNIVLITSRSHLIILKPMVLLNDDILIFVNHLLKLQRG